MRLIRQWLALIALLAVATSASAQGIKTTSSAQSVSRATFNALQDVQAMMDAEQYDEALARLEALVIETEDNAYDFALTNQYVAHISVLVDNPGRARTALQSALSKEGLPPELRGDMNLFYGTILIGDEEYELARAALEEWFALAPLPTPTHIFSLAYANYQTANLPRADLFTGLAVAAKDRAIVRGEDEIAILQDGWSDQRVVLQRLLPA